MRILFVIPALLMAYVAIDGALGLPVFDGGNVNKLQLVGLGKLADPKGSTINDETNSGRVTKRIPFTFSNLVKKIQRNMRTPPVKPNSLFSSHGRTKRSESKVFQQVGMENFADLKSAIIKDDTYSGPVIQWTLLPHLLENLKRNMHVLPVKSDRQVSSHRRTKRSEYESFKHYFYRVIWPVIMGKNTMG